MEDVESDEHVKVDRRDSEIENVNEQMDPDEVSAAAMVVGSEKWFASRKVCSACLDQI